MAEHLGKVFEIGLYWFADAQNAEGQWTQATFGNDVTTLQAFDANTGRVQTIGSSDSGPMGPLNIQNYSVADSEPCRQSIPDHAGT